MRDVGENGEDDPVANLKISIAQSLSNCRGLQRVSGSLGLGGRGRKVIARSEQASPALPAGLAGHRSHRNACPENDCESEDATLVTPREVSGKAQKVG